MRPYPRNSPQAAARIVALAMLADGRLARAELAAFARSKALRRLGLDAAGWQIVVQALCDDLVESANLTDDIMCTIEPSTLATVMAEIDDASLRRTVLDLCVAVVVADAHVAEEEHTVLAAACAAWGVHRTIPPPDTEPDHAGDARRT